MTKLHYDNHLIATCIELKYIEKYIYNTCTCSNKKNPILRKRTIKSIYCIGTYTCIVHMRGREQIWFQHEYWFIDMFWTYFIEWIEGIGKKSSWNLIFPLQTLIHFIDDLHLSWFCRVLDVQEIPFYKNSVELVKGRVYVYRLAVFKELLFSMPKDIPVNNIRCRTLPKRGVGNIFHEKSCVTLR